METEKVLVASGFNSNMILDIFIVSNSFLFLVAMPGAPSSVHEATRNLKEIEHLVDKSIECFFKRPSLIPCILKS